MNRRELFQLGRSRAGLKHRAENPGSGGDASNSDIPITGASIPDIDGQTNPLEPYIPLASDPWDYTKAAHLLRRSVIGPTETEIRDCVTLGFAPTLELIFEPFKPDLDLIEDFAGRDPEVGGPDSDDPYLQIWQAAKLSRRERLGRWWLKVIATSPLSLQERMTLFWHSHFISEMPAVEYAEFMYAQNDLFRRFAFGNFKELVGEVTRDMAMLIYLNGVENHVSWKGSMINENYARELMELFTMGVHDWDGKANYTQKDVVAAARSLSGWWYRLSPDGERHRSLRSEFVPDRWDSGVKTFLGHTGAFSAEDIIDIIFRERPQQVARFICEKLYRAFVNMTPNRPVIAAMARLFIESGWEIRPVLEALFGSAHFYNPDNIGALHKSTVDFHAGLIRSLRVKKVLDFTPRLTGSPYNDLMMRLQRLGHMLFFPPNVKGWPGGRNWTNVAALPTRQKFAIEMAEENIGYWDGTTVVKTYTFNPIAFARTFPDPNDINSLCDHMARAVLAAPPSDKEREQLYSALLDGGAPYEWNIDDPAQRPAQRIRRFLKTAFKLPKHQLH